MPTIKPKRAAAREIFESFDRLGGARNGSHGNARIQNLRILSDGSLEKRNGSVIKHSMRDKLRGFWQGTVEGISYSFTVAGSGIYRVSGSTYTLCNHLTREAGRVQFVQYRGYLYLMDGEYLYVYEPNGNYFRMAQGYTPVVGRGWNPVTLGEWIEPLNLLNKRMQFSYLNTTAETVFKLPFYAESVDRVVADGREIFDYTFEEMTDRLTFPRPYIQVSVCITATFGEERTRPLHRTQHAFCDRIDDVERLILYGADVGNYLYVSAKVDQNQLNASLAVYDDSDPLYFPATLQLPVGDTAHPVRTIYRNHDRLIAMSERGTDVIYVDPIAETVSAYPLHRGVTCTAVLPDLKLPEGSLVINKSGIFFLNSAASDPDRPELTYISQDVDFWQRNDFIHRAIVTYNPTYNELWFACPNAQGEIWVYHLQKKQWYLFVGHDPTFFLDYGGSIGVAVDRNLYVFESTATTDAGKPIVAVLQTGYLDLGAPEHLKRSLRVSMLTEHCTALLLYLESEHTTAHFDWRPDDSDSNAPRSLDRRVGIGRFRLLRVRLFDDGISRLRIYRLALFANL